MRQAGRYLPEYRAMRARYSFLELCKTPELAAEVTLQPVGGSGSTPRSSSPTSCSSLEPMGVGLEFAKGEGPVIHNPVRIGGRRERLRRVDVDRRACASSSRPSGACARELRGEVPLIGFSGAPFTLASYVIEGGGSRTYLDDQALMYRGARRLARADGAAHRRITRAT